MRQIFEYISLDLFINLKNILQQKQTLHTFIWKYILAYIKPKYLKLAKKQLE